MSTPDPTPQPAPAAQPSGFTPSASTGASGVGASLAAVVIYLLSLKGITFPAGMEALIAGLFTAFAGYLPRSGRQVSPKI
jgi:hypothetical protein